ncbi:MAG: beta-glucosidase [Flavobacteriaceae bacterium]|nr:beta-glucosidase [Flavobacteriaceae bacterium]NVJ72024.1 beta-glucosidase [Flavobacteriaceae bacterium]
MTRNTVYGLFLLGLVIISCSKPSPSQDADPDIFDQLNPKLEEELTDNQLLDSIQYYTLKYFTDAAHSSGMARERNHPARNNFDLNTVTSGGSGFGVMAIIAGVNRGFLTRTEARQKIDKICDFLLNSDRFHGAFPHWYYGDTGKVKPFSSDDNGGDIVETAFMIQGLLTARQYFNQNTTEETTLRSKITKLWEEVEWDWYTKEGTTYLWHWSPNYGFSKNHQLKGWNEVLITYILGAASPTHPIDTDLYHNLWTKGNFYNGATYYNNLKLPLGPSYGGPLFFSHYSFLGLDPRNLSDTYANYWNQNKMHSLINYEYCKANPKSYPHYSDKCWGLTASYSVNGYSAHSPTNDKGVITPTAALSSIPYSSSQSLRAVRHFYYDHKELWGPYGFYDAFSVGDNWISDGYLAIDQGPIVVMIENYRSGLLWNMFMKDQEIQAALTKLGFNF